MILFACLFVGMSVLRYRGEDNEVSDMIRPYFFLNFYVALTSMNLQLLVKCRTVLMGLFVV